MDNQEYIDSLRAAGWDEEQIKAALWINEQMSDLFKAINPKKVENQDMC